MLKREGSYDTAYLDVAKQIKKIEAESGYAMLARQVDQVYQSVGARVIRGVAADGSEGDLRFDIPPEDNSQGFYPDYPA